MTSKEEPFITKTVKVIRCTHCHYEWQPRFNRLPVACPHCMSRKYLEPRQRKAHTKNRTRKSQLI